MHMNTIGVCMHDAIVITHLPVNVIIGMCEKYIQIHP